MVRYLSALLLVCVLFLTSCEDKEKSKIISSETAPDSSSITIDSAAISNNEIRKEKEKADPWINIEGPLIVQEELIPFLTEYGAENKETRIKIITRFGEIEVLLHNNTPLHRANFIYMAKLGYFDGTFFHRVAKGFVIQGGNSDNRDTSRKRNKIGSYLIPSEFEAGHRHTRGAFAAAKYAEQNVSKASSPFEFYIVQSPGGANHLDNDHTVFGRVVKGMDVVDAIAEEEVGEGEWPHLNIHIRMEVIE